MRVAASPASKLTLRVCCIESPLPLTALADFTGLQTQERTDLQPLCQDPSNPEIPYKLDVCNVYAVFDDPTDLLISVGFSAGSTTDPNGFYQHSMNFTDTAPACALIALEPTVECDSYVTVGLDCFGLADGTTPDPDWNTSLFNSSGQIAGGWYNSAPGNGQGVPDASGRVLIAQFSVKQNKNVSGTLSVFARLAGEEDATEFPLQAFDCFGGGGAGPSGGSDPVPQAEGGGTAGAGGGANFCLDVELGGENEPAIAVNPLNPLNIAVAWNPGGLPADPSPQQLTVSTDGGQTWCGPASASCSEPLEAAFPPSWCPNELNTCQTGGDSSVAFDSGGRLYWTYLAVYFDASDPDNLIVDFNFIVMEVDPTTGLQLEDAVAVIENPTNDTGQDVDKPWLTADSTSSQYANRLYMIWTDAPDDSPRYIAVSYTDDLQTGWSTPAAISPTDGSEGTLKISHIAVGPGGVVYAAYHSQTGFTFPCGNPTETPERSSCSARWMGA